LLVNDISGASEAKIIEAFSLIRADTFFMGVTGIHPEAGLSTGDLRTSNEP
jgi:DeoR/GlpR family transcriptional regulator of sugar metabolism